MRRSVGISYRERKTSSCHASAAQKVFDRKTMARLAATRCVSSAHSFTIQSDWSSPDGIHFDHTAYCCNKYSHDLILTSTATKSSTWTWTATTSSSQLYFVVLGRPLCLTRLQTALHSEKSNAIRHTQSGLGGAYTSMAHWLSLDVNDPRRTATIF